MSVGMLILANLTINAVAASDKPDSLVAKATTISSLTGPKSKPFHLKVTVSEPENPTSPYTGTIEEYWRSGDDWSRSIKTANFQQSLVMKDRKRSEQNIGDYYPLWLQEFVTAITDPLQDASFWEKVSARLVIMSSSNGGQDTSCARAQFKVGTAAINNDAFAVICFNGDGTLSSVVRPGYDMEFHDARPFGKKRIAYQYINFPEPGTRLVGQVEVLEELDSDTIAPFSMDGQPSSSAIQTVPINQDTFEKLLAEPLAIKWPAVHSGNTKGLLSMYVSVDRSGQVREAYPLNSDNAGLQDAARDQLLKVKLKPAVVRGETVQTEVPLTFRFSTFNESDQSGAADAAQPESVSVKPIIVSLQIANSLRLRMFAPVYPQDLKVQRVGGTVRLNAIIGKQGQVVSATVIDSPNAELAGAATAAVKKWTYKPYLLNGNPVEIQTTITLLFNAP
jgi:TonB family protein